VLLSSHLLHEIEVVADHLVVIGGGRIVADGSKSELLGAAGTLVRGPDTAALERSLTAAGLTSTATADGALLVQGRPRAGRPGHRRRRGRGHRAAHRRRRRPGGAVPVPDLRHRTRAGLRMTTASPALQPGQ
jgi:ABC-type glutathione transport system ATPase component